VFEAIVPRPERVLSPTRGDGVPTRVRFARSPRIRREARNLAPIKTVPRTFVRGTRYVTDAGPSPGGD